MLRSLLRIGFAVVCALASVGAVAAPRYVEAPPLATVLASAKIGEVAAGPVQVPIITWGGDMATIFANGNQARTARGSVFAQEQLDLSLVREDVFAKQIEAYLSGRSPYLRGTARHGEHGCGCIVARSAHQTRHRLSTHVVGGRRCTGRQIRHRFGKGFTW